MVLSCFVICQWAGADASYREALANDCQDAKETSFSLAAEAYNLAIIVTIAVCFFLCLPLSLLSMWLMYWLLIAIYDDGNLYCEHNKQYFIPINT